jgi:hypothetical protein
MAPRFFFATAEPLKQCAFYNPQNLLQELLFDYIIALVKAVIIAAGGDITEVAIDHQTIRSQNLRSPMYLRDLIVLLPGINLAIYPSGFMLTDIEAVAKSIQTIDNS